MRKNEYEFVTERDQQNRNHKYMAARCESSGMCLRFEKEREQLASSLAELVRDELKTNTLDYMTPHHRARVKKAIDLLAKVKL